MGFQDALAEHPGINVRASLRGDYQRDVARDGVSPRQGSVGRPSTPCCAPTTSWRSACWMRSALMPGAGPLVVGVNAIPEAVAAIAAGRMLATADFNAMAMSEIATEAAVRHLRGETIPPKSCCRSRWSMPPTARRGTRRSRRAPPDLGRRWFAAELSYLPAPSAASFSRLCDQPASMPASICGAAGCRPLALRRHGELGAAALLLERHHGDAIPDIWCRRGPRQRP